MSRPAHPPSSCTLRTKLSLTSKYFAQLFFVCVCVCTCAHDNDFAHKCELSLRRYETTEKDDPSHPNLLMLISW